MRVVTIFCTCLMFFYQTIDVNGQSITAADSLSRNGKYSEAIFVYNKILLSTINIPDSICGNVYLQKGICYYYLDQLDSSLNNYFLALKIFEKIKNTRGLSLVTINISSIYFYKEDFNKSEKYLDYAFSYSESLKDSTQSMRILFQKGILLNENAKSVEAINLYKKLQLEYSSKMSQELMARFYNNLGHFFHQHEPDSALHYFLEAEKTSAAVQNTLLYTIHSNIGDLYLKKGNFRKALEYLNNSYESPDILSDSIQLSLTCRSLANAYDSLKIYDTALLYLRRSTEIEAKLADAEKAKIAAELSEKYESDKKDEKIRMQEIENKLKNRNLLLSLGGLGFVAALAIISFINYQRKQKANKLLQAQNIRIENLNKELDTSNQVKTKLFSVISHDLRSPISSLYAYLQLKNNSPDKKDIAPINQTQQLLETLEDLLIWSKSQLYQFSPSIEPINLFDLSNNITSLLENTADTKNITVTNTISPDLIIASDLNMLTIIIRNLVSNAVRYALPGTHIKIEAQKNSDITIIISNDTNSENATLLNTPEESKITSNKSGLGTMLVKEFVAKLNGNFSFSLNQNRVTATVTLPKL